MMDETFRSEGVAVGDINNDGTKDLVTGKRYYANMGRHLEGNEPAVLYQPKPAKSEYINIDFIPHQVDYDSGIGTQFGIIDMNDDNRPDIVISNKKSVYMFLKQIHINP